MAQSVIRELERALRRAWRTTLHQEEHLFDFANGTTGTEWNVASHFAWRLRAKFREYDCDIELRKGDFGGRRPDIVVHRRGTHDFNYLVIETKLDPDRLLLDEEKIRRYWFEPELSYAFGAAIVLSREDCEIHVERNATAPPGRFVAPPVRTRRRSQSHGSAP